MYYNVFTVELPDGTKREVDMSWMSSPNYEMMNNDLNQTCQEIELEVEQQYGIKVKVTGETRKKY